MKRLIITVRSVGTPALAFAEDVARLLLAGTQHHQHNSATTNHPAGGHTLTASRYTKATRRLCEKGEATKTTPSP